MPRLIDFIWNTLSSAHPRAANCEDAVGIAHKSLSLNFLVYQTFDASVFSRLFTPGISTLTSPEFLFLYAFCIG
jgi:hypothetical protein